MGVMIDALILDLGNVLVFHDNELLFERMSAAFGVSREVLAARLDTELWARVNRGGLPGDALRVELRARLGRELDRERWLELWNCHFRVHHAMLEAIDALVGRVRLVLLSNTHDDHFGFLRPRLPVLERFDGLVLSYEEGLVKPERGIYERALAVAGVPASRAAFFDDVPGYVAAAEALGISARVFSDVPAFVRDARALGIPVHDAPALPAPPGNAPVHESAGRR